MTQARSNYMSTASSIAQWQSAGIKCGRSRVQSPVKNRLLDSLVVECWLQVREVPGSIPSQGPPPRQPSDRVLTSSVGGPGFNPQYRLPDSLVVECWHRVWEVPGSIPSTASPIAQWYSAGIECGRSRVQSPVPPLRQPSGIVMASSVGGPGFNPQYRLPDSLVVECWHRVWEVPGSIPSTGSPIAQWQSAGIEYGRSRVQSPVPPPRQPSGRVLASNAGGPGFNPQSRTASPIAQWQSAGIECGRSRVQSPVKDRLIDSLVVECWHRVWEVPGSIPSQGPPH